METQNHKSTVLSVALEVLLFSIPKDNNSFMATPALGTQDVRLYIVWKDCIVEYSVFLKKNQAHLSHPSHPLPLHCPNAYLTDNSPVLTVSEMAGCVRIPAERGVYQPPAVRRRESGPILHLGASLQGRRHAQEGCVLHEDRRYAVCRTDVSTAAVGTVLLLVAAGASRL